MKIIFMGTPDFAVPVLKEILRAGHEVPLVVTQPDKARGRSGRLTPTPVKETALENGLRVESPERLRKSNMEEIFREIGPDLVVVSAYGQIIPPGILEIPRFGCVNTHASLLPKYRGAAPIQHAILNGEAKTGVTIMQMDEGLDTGDIIETSVVPIASDETGGSLFEKLSLEAARLLVETIPKIETGNVTFTKQPKESPTPYASMIRKEMGRLDFSLPADQLERQIRAFDPQPGSFAFLNGKTLKVWKAEAEKDSPETGVPGTVLYAEKKGIRIACGQGVLCLTQVQLEGKKRMPAEAFLRGYTLGIGTMLE